MGNAIYDKIMKSREIVEIPSPPHHMSEYKGYENHSPEELSKMIRKFFSFPIHYCLNFFGPEMTANILKEYYEECLNIALDEYLKKNNIEEI